MPNLVDQLDAEWTLLTSDPRCCVTAWSALCPALAGCSSLPDLLPAIRRSPDEALTFLIGRHQNGEHLAGRVVLQTMLGKLVKMSYSALARRERHPLDDLVTQMWCQIDGYRLDRRPRSIAANLALDTLKAVQKEWRRDGEISIPPIDAAIRWECERARQPLADVDWDGQALIESAYQQGLITESTRDILTAVYGPDGVSGRAAAIRHHCTPAAIRRRCSTAIHDKLRPFARELAAR